MDIRTIEDRFWKQYKDYTSGTGKEKEELQPADKTDKAFRKTDMLDISKTGYAALKGQNDSYEKLSSVSSYSVMNAFEEAVTKFKDDFSEKDNESAKSDMFDRHVSQMTSAYYQMKDAIEEKYADPERKQEYYVADDGSVQELTKEKELEMLDKAYENHSKFMAETTEIWNNLKDFKAQITYTSGKGAATQPQQEPSRDVKKGEIRNQAFEAFMSAIRGNYTEYSPSAKASLNGIWDYFLNLK